MSVDLSIVIPTLNESERIGKTLDELAAYLRGQKHSVEILIVDAQSPDGTAQVAKEHAKDFAHFHVINAGPRPKGKFIKGKQVQQGVFAAHGRYILFMDADLATPLKYLGTVFRMIDEKKSVAICVRDLQSSHKGLRKFVSGAGNFLVQLLLLPGIKDTQCGFKLFDRESAHTIFARQTITSWGFDMELLALARKFGYKIELIDVPDWKDVEEGSKIGGTAALKAAIQTLPDLISIRWGLLTGRYNKVHYHDSHKISSTK